MKITADFHIHSKYSRACSPRMELGCLSATAQKKGINVLGTGDFTHPEWFKALKKLSPAEAGLFKMGDTRFILTSEISCIYSKKGKVRKVHMLVFAPSLEAASKLNASLSKIGNLKADGRPILGLDAKELLKMALAQGCFSVPCHVWTPWFSVFGSKSGFDSLRECFDDYSKHIYAAETGLSSDPAMNWRVPVLDGISLISCSDAHSPEKLGREACVFDTELSYQSIINSIKTRKGFLYTIEFFPEEGKYHYDGHRSCNVSLSPKETKKYNGLCPVCSKPLTFGVLHRVEDLAGRGNSKPKSALPFKSLIPLSEIIAEVLGCGVGTKGVKKIYENMTAHFGSEFNVLISVPFSDLKESFPLIAEGIIRVRQGKVKVVPGYDGVYGEIKIFSDREKQNFSKQKTLF